MTRWRRPPRQLNNYGFRKCHTDRFEARSTPRCPCDARVRCAQQSRVRACVTHASRALIHRSRDRRLTRAPLTFCRI